jgi:hypothetical protein
MVRSPFSSARRRGRKIARLARAILPVVAVVMLGCGGSGDATVASVQGATITKRELAHWTHVKTVELQGSPQPSNSISGPEQAALAFLITADWLEGEAAAQGVHVRDADVKASYRSLLDGPTGGSFAASLKRRDMSEPDELRLLRLSALASKLRTKVAGSEHTPLSPRALRRVTTFQTAFRERWRLRTSCRSGYVIAECRDGPAIGSPAGVAE